MAVTAGVGGTAAESAGSAPVARMDELWAHRDADDALQELVSVGTTAVASDPQSYDTAWRVARAYFWVADTQSNRVVKKAMAAQAMEWADRARRLQPDRVEGHYLYAIAVGEYADTIDVVQAIVERVAAKVESAALRAYEIDRDYYYGAPATVLGRYYFMLPWPKRDLERSRRYLEESVARHPHALIAHCYLADTYYALGAREPAREQLTFVLTNEPELGTELDRPSPKAMASEEMQRWFPGIAGGQASR